MKRILGRVRDYRWGSEDVIPHFFGLRSVQKPIAEVWFGAHPAAPSPICAQPGAQIAKELAVCESRLKNDRDTEDCPAGAPFSLRDYIAADPQAVLGSYAVSQFGGRLPFLLKLIAPRKPLSLQVHPTAEQALAGYARENDLGIPKDSPYRTYRDRNHKPELVYALSRFEGLVGFRSPRRILGVLEDLDTAVAKKLIRIISRTPGHRGVQAAFNYLLSEETRPGEEQIAELIFACAARDPRISPSPRADAIVTRLARYYPEDPGVICSLLLNPVTLDPGEALFIPVGTIHAYLSGFGVEVMANSDNVLRAGLTQKHMDLPELINVADTVAAPPIRIAPEKMSAVQKTFYAPVDDFELSVVQIAPGDGVCGLRGCGPRILLGLEGELGFACSGGRFELRKGQAVFLGTDDGAAEVGGFGICAQVGVP